MNLDPSSQDFAQYLQMFVDESEEQLDDLVETLLQLEQNPSDVDSIATAFRLLHSIKGAAGMMGLAQITTLTHHLETRFERIRSGRVTLDEATMNVTLRSIDFLKQCNEDLRAGRDLSTPDELLHELNHRESAAAKESELEKRRGSISQETPTVETSSQTQETPNVNSEVYSTNQPETHKTSFEEEPPNYHLVLSYDKGSSSEEIAKLATRLESLGIVRATRPEIDELEVLHDSTDTFAFDVILSTDKPFPSIEELICQDDSCPRSLIIQLPHGQSTEPLHQWQRASIASEETEPLSSVPIPKTTRPTAIEPSSIPPKQTTTPGGDTSKEQSSGIVETMRVETGRLDDLMNLTGELVVNRAEFESLVERLQEDLQAATGAGFSSSIDQALQSLAQELMRPDRAREDLLNQVQAIRQSVVTQNSGLQAGQRRISRLEETVDRLHSVSSSLQRGVLSTRMVPIGPLLNRFKRTVRDLSRACSKSINLIVEGEATELDKRMVDALADPLLHLIRNSVDHGIETPSQREASGKTSDATIRLRASHRGNSVVIEIEDDGGGVDVERVKQKAIQRGLIDTAEAEQLADGQIVALIWQPGFSTATEVSDVSGRGVGMDIVRSTVRSVGGTVECESQVGQGTKFIIRLPLTMAIIQALLIEAHGVSMAIPMDHLDEIVSVDQAKSIQLGQQHTFELRGKYLRCVNLSELMDFNHIKSVGFSERPEVLQSSNEIAVVRAGEESFGILIDQAIGIRDIVVKSLRQNFTDVPGLAGASIMGDGSVALILDVGELNQRLSVSV
ncbi:MAG: chemotaxis protein CheA [Planctomycetota bacterium]